MKKILLTMILIMGFGTGVYATDLIQPVNIIQGANVPGIVIAITTNTVTATLSNTSETVLLSSGSVNQKYVLQNCLATNTGTAATTIQFRGSGNGGNTWFYIADPIYTSGTSGFINKNNAQPVANANITVQLGYLPVGGSVFLSCDYYSEYTQ